jgi:hypothetical protein
MKALLPALAAACVCTATLAYADPPQPPKKAAAPTKPEAVFVNPAEIKWGDAPPSLPKGAQLAVLHGDPAKHKEPYTLRLKLPAGYKVAGHWHTKDEQLTIISGTLLLHMGDNFDAPAHTLEAGSFHFHPGGMHHAAQTVGETVVQVDGIGPFEIHYLNPKDDPTKTASR